MKSYRATLLASAIMLTAAPAFADDYTDLLNILQAKGSLTHSEYTSLMAKHQHSARAPRGRRGATQTTTTTVETDESMSDAHRDALAAAASAAAAQAALQKGQMMMTEMQNSPDIVHAEPYKLGSGVTIRIGSVDLNFSGIVNGFYTYSSADHGANTAVGGGLADASGFDSSAIRNGLLPGAFIASASTTQDGIDVAAVFGVYPGIDSANVGALNANNGGNSTALGTAGVDFRKTYLTVGTKSFGTIKIGRDIGIYGSDAILNDATLLSVGATGGNADPANTSLGRIGLGYIYADFMPQITYISPIFAGFQVTVGAFQPLNEFDFAGSDGVAGSTYEGSALSGTASGHNVPEFEGKLTYDYAPSADLKARAWVGFMTQPQQQITTAITYVNGARVAGSGTLTGQDKLAGAGEVGAKVDFGPFGLTGYYYRGKGVGTTGKFFDGISADGQLRDSEGGYVQGSWKPLPKLKLVASYGESSLNQAAGDVDPLLVRRNEAYIGAGYYSLTDWVTVVGEYAHQEDKSHGDNKASSDAFTAGAILFY